MRGHQVGCARQDLVDRLAVSLAGWVMQDRFGRLVDHKDFAGTVGDDDAIKTVLDHAIHQGAACGDCFSLLEYLTGLGFDPSRERKQKR